MSYDGMTRSEAKSALAKFMQKHCGLAVTVTHLMPTLHAMSLLRICSRPGPARRCTLMPSRQRMQEPLQHATAEPPDSPVPRHPDCAV